MQELKELLGGLAPSQVVSVKSPAYRSLGLAERRLSDEELLQLMVKEPRLLRRPLIAVGDELVVSFDQKRLEELLR